MSPFSKIIIKLSLVIGLLVFISPIILFGQELPRFTILTEDWRPYQYIENGQLKGVAVDLLVKMLEKTGSAQNRDDIQIVPWARGYSLLQNQKNTILFSTTRTLERDSRFKWVGPIFQNTTYLIGKKSRNFSIHSAQDLINYRIGTIIDDAGERYMLNLGIPLEKLQRNVKAVYNVKKLAIDRIDFVVTGWTAFVNDAIEARLNPNLYMPVYTVDRADVSYAFHSDTPDWIINRFQQTLNLLKDQGHLEALYKKYKHPTLTTD